jgi:hypothetical protein
MRYTSGKDKAGGKCRFDDVWREKRVNTFPGGFSKAEDQKVRRAED